MGLNVTRRLGPDVTIAFLIAVFSFCYFLVFYHGHFSGSDEVHLLETTKSLVERGELSIPRILNSEPGPDGRAYGRYEIGQSVLAMPWYLAGRVLARHLPSEWQELVAGVRLEEGPLRWGGTLEIFATGLFAPFAAAVLAGAFYWLEHRLGTTRRTAAILSLVLAVSTYVATMSGYFLRHVFPAALILVALTCFRIWRETGNVSLLLAGSVSLAASVQVRADTLLTIPAFLFYVSWRTTVDPRRGRPVESALLLAQRFGLPLIVSLLFLFSVNYAKWGRLMAADRSTIQGAFQSTPLYVSLYAFLLSPGLGFFVYSPPALLVIPAWRRFWNSFRAEAVTFLLIGLAFLAVYSSYEDWHGLWSAPGPRYLFLLVPLAMLPVGWWLDQGSSPLSKLGTAILTAIGLGVHIPLMAVNFSYAYHQLGYPDYVPRYSFLFIPNHSPPVTSARLMARGELIDSWLWNMATGWSGAQGHPVTATVLFVLILTTGVLSLWILSRKIRTAEGTQSLTLQKKLETEPDVP